LTITHLESNLESKRDVDVGMLNNWNINIPAKKIKDFNKKKKKKYKQAKKRGMIR
jgi:hypothetical protein